MSVRPRDFVTSRREGETASEHAARWDREEDEHRARFKDDFGRFAEAFVHAMADKGGRKP